MKNKIFVMKDFIFDLQRFDSAFGGVDGSQTNPYQIASVEDLQQLSNDVNGGNNSEYTSINMKINCTTSSQGLFAYNSGTVDGCTVTGNIGGFDKVGGIVGNNIDSTVDDCFYHLETATPKRSLLKSGGSSGGG